MGSRPVETDIQLPLFIREHATPAALRMPDNPFSRAVYTRGRVSAWREATGEIVEYIRCQHCGELKEARRWNFSPHALTKSGYEHVCRDCRNKQQRQWREGNPDRTSYMRDYMRKYRGGRRVDESA